MLLKTKPIISLVTIFAITTVSLFSFKPVPSFACSCLPSQSATEEAKTSMIFSGKVSKIQKGNFENLIMFDIYQWQKEPYEGMGDGKTYGVNTAPQSAACGYEFEEGKEYLVYAKGRPQSDAFEVSLCSRTAPLAEAIADLKELNMTIGPGGTSIVGAIATETPTKPTATSVNSTTSSSTKIFSNSATLTTLIIIIVGGLIIGLYNTARKRK